MLAELQEIDLKLFTIIHHQLSNALFDVLMPLVREKKIWIPLYVFVLFHIHKFYGKKVLLQFIGVTILCVAATDSLGGQILKPYFHRIRPCNENIEHLHALITCSQGFSFPSNHASNHFCLAMLFSLFFNKKVWLFIWAGSIVFAQVYVGVHYPFDVLGGAFIGLAIGSIGYLVAKKYIVHV